MPLKESAACFQLVLNDAGMLPKKHKNILVRLKVLELKSSYFSFIHCIFGFNHEMSCICLVDACSQAQIYMCVHPETAIANY